MLYKLYTIEFWYRNVPESSLFSEDGGLTKNLTWLWNGNYGKIPSKCRCFTVWERCSGDREKNMEKSRWRIDWTTEAINHAIVCQWAGTTPCEFTIRVVLRTYPNKRCELFVWEWGTAGFFLISLYQESNKILAGFHLKGIKKARFIDICR